MENVLVKKLAKTPMRSARAALPGGTLPTLCAKLAAVLSTRFDCAADVKASEIEHKTLAEHVDSFESPATAALVEFDAPPGLALLRVDQPMLFHMMDLFLGSDPNAPGGAFTRPLTVLDTKFYRSIAGVFCDAFAKTLSERSTLPSPVKMHCAKLRRERANLLIVPENEEILTFSLSITLGTGEREGTLELAMPAELAAALAGGKSSQHSDDQPEDSGRWSTHLRKTLFGSELDVVSVVHQTRMSLAELSRLDVGDFIALPRNAIDQVPLLAEDGDIVTSGKLGSMGGRRAIRLTAPPSGEFFGTLMESGKGGLIRS